MTQQSDTPAPAPPLVAPAGDIEAAIAQLRPFVAAIESDDDEAEACACRKCNDLYYLETGMDPTPLCHDCAQEAVAHLPNLLAVLSKLTEEAEIPSSTKFERAIERIADDMISIAVRDEWPRYNREEITGTVRKRMTVVVAKLVEDKEELEREIVLRKQNESDAAEEVLRLRDQLSRL